MTQLLTFTVCLRLGLHVTIFYATFCEWFRNKRQLFFAPYTCFNFFHSSLLMIQNRGKIKLIKIHFLSWILFLHEEQGCSCIWSWLFYSQHLHMLLWFYMDKLSVLLKNVWRKNCSEAHGRTPIYFNMICFFCGIIHRYLRKKIATCSPSLKMTNY